MQSFNTSANSYSYDPYFQQPAVFYIQNPAQDNSMKMNQRTQLIQAFRNSSSSCGRYIAMVFSFLSIIAGAGIAYAVISLDYWDIAKEVDSYASQIKSVEDLYNLISNDADSCFIFAICIQVCAFFGIAFAVFHLLTFSLYNFLDNIRNIYGNQPKKFI